MANKEIQIRQKVNEVWKPLFIHRNGIRYIILMGGRGAGRSYAASQYALARLTGKGYFRCAIMRAVHSDIRLSLWQELNDRIAEQGIEEAEGLNLVDNKMSVSYGDNVINAIGFRAGSGTRSAKLKSLANYNTVIIEEAEEIGESEFRTLDDSLRTVKDGQEITVVFCLNTPAKSHWFIREFFDLVPSDEYIGFYTPVLNEKHKDDSLFLYYNFEANASNLDAHTIKRYEDYKNTNPAYYYQVIKGLCPETVRGRIYKDWRLIDEVPHEAKLVRRGMDFGWSPDPLHLCDIYYFNGGYILDQLIHGLEIENKTVADVIKAQTYPSVLTVADSAEEKSIKEIKGYGVNIVGAEKGPDSVIFGIKVVAGMRISVTKRSTNLWESYENYAWKETKDGVSLGIPNHYLSDPMDAARYGLTSLLNTQSPEQEKKSAAENYVKQQEFVNMQAKRAGL